MKTVFTFLTLPVISLIVFFSIKCYLAGDFFAAYALVLGWFASFTLWINAIGGRFQKPAASAPAAPRVPRAYITR